MIGQFLAIFLALTVGVAVVMSTPILPVGRITRMESPDACLFVCNICFHDNDEKMVSCANNYCLSPEMYTGLPYLAIGKRCEHWENLDKYVLSELRH